jgi:Helix-turn-helix domain of resolvase
MSVEDWAEIRRLRRAEGMPIKAIAPVMGVGRDTVRRALAAEGPPEVSACFARLAGRCGRAADSGAVAGLSADAGHGNRRAGRMGLWDHHPDGPGP